MTWLAHALRYIYMLYYYIISIYYCVYVYICIWLQSCLIAQRAHMIKNYVQTFYNGSFAVFLRWGKRLSLIIENSVHAHTDFLDPGWVLLIMLRLKWGIVSKYYASWCITCTSFTNYSTSYASLWYLFSETIQNNSRFWNKCGSHWDE